MATERVDQGLLATMARRGRKMISAYREEIRALVPMVEKHLKAIAKANGKAPAESVWLTTHVGTSGTVLKRIRNGLSILPDTAMKIRETIERERAAMKSTTNGGK